MQHQPHDAEALLRQFVEGRDVPCPSCGYNLRNTTSTRCPECGTTLTLNVNARRAKLGAAFWAILAAAGPLGLYLTGLGMAIYSVVDDLGRFNSYRPNTMDVKVTGVLAGASFLYAALLATSVRSSEWLAGRGAVKRRLFVLTWVVSLLAIHVLIVRWILEIID
jgi:hypothetical protein